MAQLPLKFPTSFYIAHTTSTVADPCSPRTSTESIFKLPRLPSLSSEGSNDKKALRSILHFFRSPLRKRVKTPPSSKRFKFIACFSNGKHPPQVEAEAEADDRDQVKWDSFSSSSDSDSVGSSEMQSSDDMKEMNTSKDDNNNKGIKCASFVETSPVYAFEREDGNVGDSEEVNLDLAYSSAGLNHYSSHNNPMEMGNSEEINLDLDLDLDLVKTSTCLDHYSSHNNAMKIDLISVSGKELRLDLFKCSREIVTLESVKKGEGSLAIGHAHGFALFIAKVLKVMNYSGSRLSMNLSKDAKRRLQIMLVTVNQKGKKKSRGSKKKENREQIWTKPIMMGKRCRKLDDDFPYGEDEERVVAAVSMVV